MRRHALRALLSLAATLGAAALLAPAAAAQQPGPGPPVVVDGPSAAIARPSGLAMSIARDGTGGLVYLRQVGGAEHVFLSALVGGSFQAPVQVDPSLGGGSSQPVIAAGRGGLLLIGFINGGQLYVVGRTGQLAALSAPLALAGSAMNPAVSMSNFGKAYLAFTVPDGAGHDVRAAYYYNGAWSLEAPPLNATPADNAGTGSGRPEVAAAGDGVGIVVWGEDGHVYSRRVWGTAASVVDEQADAPPSGCTEGSADEPVLGVGGDSSYVEVAFDEEVTCGGVQQSRVLMNRLQASIYDGITQPDGLSGTPSDGADDPQITMGEYGHGWVTSERSVSHAIMGGALGDNGVLEGLTQVNSLAATAAPDPVPATAGLYSNLIAWQQEPGAAGGGEIRVRYAPDGATLGPEMVLSAPAQGPTDAGDGLAAAGDVAGDAAVAWLQGAPGATQVMVEQLYQAPSPFAASSAHRYSTNPQPVLSWKQVNSWGPIRYSLTVDGTLVAQTYGTSVRLPAPLPDGPHSWSVTATNPGGLQSHAKPAIIFVDTVPPRVTLKVTGRRLAGSELEARVTYVDLPPAGFPRRDASGVAKVVMHWGDGTTVRLRLGSHVSLHAYHRAGRYRITLVVTDKAGNSTRLVKTVKIAKASSGSHG